MRDYVETVCEELANEKLKLVAGSQAGEKQTRLRVERCWARKVQLGVLGMTPHFFSPPPLLEKILNDICI